MSASNLKWELGVATVAQRFQNFNRWTKVGADFTAMSTDEYTDGIDGHDDYQATDLLKLDLDSDIASDYEEDPFYLAERQEGTTGNYILGSEILVGPSSDSDHDGAVEKAQVQSVTTDGSNNVRLYLLGQKDQAHVGFLTSAYKDGDPVLVRTLPHGWTTHSDFSSLKMRVQPIGRYDNIFALGFLENPGAYSPLPDHTNRERRTGVQLATTEFSSPYPVSNNNRYIQYISEVNSFYPYVRRWRTSWEYRLTRADYVANMDLSGATAKVYLALATADSELLFPIKDSSDNQESGTKDLSISSVDRISKNVKTYSTNQTDWTLDSIYASYRNDDTNTFNLGGIGINNPRFAAFNRGNRWVVRVVLVSGVNAAFDIDNIIIEHAHGTSLEASGYYEIDDWPNFDTLDFHEISPSRENLRLSNGNLKLSQNIFSGPKWEISAEFQNISTTIYKDLLQLMEWQKLGFPLVLRAYGTPMPKVIVGKLNIERWRTQHWNVENRVSFTFNFEEI